MTNLNRQVFFYDAIGLNKSETVARRLNETFGMDAQGSVTSLGERTDISAYDVIFDCVDNFETRIVLSEKCRDQKKVLISGGTSAEAGQVVVHDPNQDGGTPAEVLGLYGLVERRAIEASHRGSEPCVYQPDPSVITTNQIIAGFMVDAYRMLLDGQEPTNVFYDSKSNKRM
jgi:molybdopterin/thiamine biosynthesis adenylyltransferase